MTPVRYLSGLVFGITLSAVAMGGAWLLPAGAPGIPLAQAAPAPSASASADAGVQEPKVPAEVMVLHATNTGGGIDPRIGPLPQLRKPPFSAYDTYKLIARNAITLTPSHPDSTTLPNKRVLRTSLSAVLPNDRYRISTSISQPARDAGTHSFLPLLEVTAKSGETFFVAGQSYQGGILVVGIRVGK